MNRRVLIASWLVPCFAGALLNGQSPTRSVPPAGECSTVRATILVYHRFGPVVKDGMTVRTSTLRSQLQYLSQHNYPVVPLRSLVACLLGEEPPLPPRAVSITVDDGHESVFTEMLPVVREYRLPVTLFVYPSAISNASYAMTWDQLRDLEKTELFDIQSHTYWHPNFNTEKRRLAPGAYRAFVTSQLVKSRTVLKERLAADANLIAWPFGIYDEELMAAARDAGYVAGFTVERQLVTSRARIMALPRFLVTETMSPRAFVSILPGPPE